MRLDLRLPIGLMFTIFGVILILYGLLSPATVYQVSLGINVNFWWGLVLLAFGGTMLAFGIQGEARRRRAAGSQ